MPEVVKCPNCSGSITVTEDDYGKKFACRLCGQRLELDTPVDDEPLKIKPPHPDDIATEPDDLAEILRLVGRQVLIMRDIRLMLIVYFVVTTLGLVVALLFLAAMGR